MSTRAGLSPQQVAQLLDDLADRIERLPVDYLEIVRCEIETPVRQLYPLPGEIRSRFEHSGAFTFDIVLRQGCKFSLELHACSSIETKEHKR